MNEKESIRTLFQLLEDAKANLEVHEEMVRNSFKNDGVDYDKVMELVTGKKEVTKSITRENIDELIKQVTIEGKEDLVKEAIELIDDPDVHVTADLENEESVARAEAKEKEVIEFYKKAAWLKDIIRDGNEIINSRKDYDEIQQESDNNIKNYSEKITSKQYDKVIELNIETWKSSLEKVRKIDSYEARKEAKALEHRIYVMEHRYDVLFLFDRIDNPKYHKKEMNAIIDSFMRKDISSFMMERFEAASRRFGIAEDTYKYLFNLEELFLEEKYLPFNNLFLSIVLRYIGHCDDSQMDEVKVLVNGLVKLVHHKFYSMEVRNTFLDSIRCMLDKFMDYSEKFKEENVTYPGHPHRAKKDMATRNASLLERAMKDIRAAIAQMDETYDVPEADVLNQLKEIDKPDEEAGTDPLHDYLAKLQFHQVSKFRDIAVAYIKGLKYRNDERHREQVKLAKKELKDVADRYVVSHGEEYGAKVLEAMQAVPLSELNEIWSILDEDEFNKRVESVMDSYKLSKENSDTKAVETDGEDSAVSDTESITEEETNETTGAEDSENAAE